MAPFSDPDQADSEGNPRMSVQGSESAVARPRLGRSSCSLSCFEVAAAARIRRRSSSDSATSRPSMSIRMDPAKAHQPCRKPCSSGASLPTLGIPCVHSPHTVLPGCVMTHPFPAGAAGFRQVSDLGSTCCTHPWTGGGGAPRSLASTAAHLTARCVAAARPLSLYSASSAVARKAHIAESPAKRITSPPWEYTCVVTGET